MAVGETSGRTTPATTGLGVRVMPESFGASWSEAAPAGCDDLTLLAHPAAEMSTIAPSKIRVRVRIDRRV